MYKEMPMPMLDAYIPEGALSEEAEQALLAQLTDILLRTEGADPPSAYPIARQYAYVWLHRPVKILAGGEATSAPLYRIFASVPEGQYDDERRTSMVAEVTEAVHDAEAGSYDWDPMRVWVFANEVPEGTWGAGGQIYRLADIAGVVFGDAEKGRRHAERRLGVSKTA
jgi:phenylpyruvate tautomerase PptA (4-oxalocrotonate tautomerase family)